MKKIRSVIVGTGSIANAHAKGYQEQSQHYDVVACMDVDEPRAAEFAGCHGIPNHRMDFDAMLAEFQPDLVDICTPPQFHAELSIKAMEAGSDVYCEKPICGSLQELASVQAVEARTGRFCAGVFQFRCASSSLHVRDLIRKEKVGRPLVATCNTTWYRAPEYYEVAWRGKWSNEMGGPTLGHGIHAMDQLLFLLGPWQEVTAYAGTLDRAIEVEDVSVAIVRFESGTLATVVNSILSPREETYLRIDCQQATIELTHLYRFRNENWSLTPASGSWTPLARRPVSELTDPELVFPEEDTISTQGTQLGLLASHLRDRTRPNTAGPDAWQTLELVTAIYKSAYSGRPVERGEIDDGDPFYSQLNGGHEERPERWFAKIAQATV